MFYAVIDTNVLVSALLNIDSNPGAVLLSVFSGMTIPLLNPEIFAEYREVLARKKFGFPNEKVAVILKRLAASSWYIPFVSSHYPEVIDSKDRCFYAVTMTGRLTRDTLLVTGNTRHFPPQPFIVPPACFVEMLKKISTTN